MKKIIITGGTGFIGTYLSRNFVEKGFDVVTITRQNLKQIKHPEIKQLRYVQWMNGNNSWIREMEGAFGIVNLAGENIGNGRWTSEKKRSIHESRITSGKLLSNALSELKQKPEIFIQASAIGFYGNRGDETLTEASTRGEGFLASLAQEWENSSAEVEKMGTRRILIRTGVVLDRSHGLIRRLKGLYRFYLGGRLGSGQNWLSWIHISDVVDIVFFFLKEKSSQGVFNLTTPNPIRYHYLSDELARHLRKPNWLHIPASFVKILLGEMADELVLAGQRVIPEKLLNLNYNFKYTHFTDVLPIL